MFGNCSNYFQKFGFGCVARAKLRRHVLVFRRFWRTHMEETSHPAEASENTTHPEERADIKTRWKKGQSGNPRGRLAGSGNTVTWLARVLLERPVQGSESGERVTRLAEYMSDIVRRADAGDLKSRMFLINAVERGDRRKETARRNAKKAKSEELCTFEEEMAEEISAPMPPLAPEVEDEQVVKSVRPTAPTSTKASADTPQGDASRAKDSADAPASARATADKPQGPVRRPVDASTLQRNPLNGRLVTPEGRELSRAEEERLLYPNWPHISPHLKKEDPAGSQAGESAGLKSPASDGQVVDSKQDFGSENISRENPPGTAGSQTVH
jgi:hypothetical protein